MHLNIGLIGDFTPSVKAHRAIPMAIDLAAQQCSCEAVYTWLPTPSLEGNVLTILKDFDALWCVPHSPYASMEGALQAIRFARENGVPFLGTCGGVQHLLVEFARTVLGLSEADHAESSPNGPLSIIVPLACSLAESTDSIHLLPGTRTATIYGKLEITEEYNCRFGLDPQYHAQLEAHGLHITGFDRVGEARVVELDQSLHPFFFGTLFQPERSAFSGAPHPLIIAFLQATCVSQAVRQSAHTRDTAVTGS